MRILNLVFFVLICSCVQPTTNFANASKADSSKKADERIIDSVLRANRMRDSVDKVISKKKTDSLLKKFIIQKDDFQGVSFYTSKQWGKGWPNRKSLYCYLNSVGGAFLVSNFYAEDWIFHTNVQVLIDGNIYNSPVVPTYNDNNKHENSGGYVWENVTYTGADARTIIQVIALNKNKKIKVRFQGKQYYSDMSLSSGDKNAFADVYALAMLIDPIGF